MSPDDDLPKKICDGCFQKLDMLYDFRSTSLESEKHLISLLEQAGLKSKSLTNDNEIEKPIIVKQEASDRLSEDGNDENQIADDSQTTYVPQQQKSFQKDFKFSGASGSKLEESVDDPDQPEEPKPKRARRSAALAAIKSLPVETEDDEEDEEELDGTMEITKVCFYSAIIFVILDKNVFLNRKKTKIVNLWIILSLLKAKKRKKECHQQVLRTNLVRQVLEKTSRHREYLFLFSNIL